MNAPHSLPTPRSGDDTAQGRLPQPPNGHHAMAGGTDAIAGIIRALKRALLAQQLVTMVGDATVVVHGEVDLERLAKAVAPSLARIAALEEVCEMVLAGAKIEDDPELLRAATAALGRTA